MRRLFLTAALCYFSLASISTTAGQTEIARPLEQYREPSRLRGLLSDPPRDFYLVDTRTWFEYIEGHIPGAIHIYYKKIARKPPTDKRDAIIFVYCLRGIRSAEAAEKLREAGFTRVLNWGGIEDWPYEAIVGGWPGRLYD